MSIAKQDTWGQGPEPITDLELKITNDEFEKLRKIIFDQFGINLTESKKTLLVGRLQSILKKYNLKNFAEYYDFINNSKDMSALSELVNRISTNFTYFYREEKHFEFFINKALPEWMGLLNGRNERDLRLWCAGCSSGEEPYTIIMMMLDKLKNEYHLWNSGILATDISENALNFAIKGAYPADRLQKLPPQLKNQFFKKINDEEFQISEKVQKEVTFRRLNLMNETFPFKKKFHMIFCRNVMIYFDNPTKEALVQRFSDNLEVGGYLFIGHSETIGRNNPTLDYVAPALYKKVR